jgi:hypothetical protein
MLLQGIVGEVILGTTLHLEYVEEISEKGVVIRLS